MGEEERQLKWSKIKEGEKKSERIRYRTLNKTPRILYFQGKHYDK